MLLSVSECLHYSLDRGPTTSDYCQLHLGLMFMMFATDSAMAPVTTLTAFCGLDAKLATIHRELRYLIKTLARLRHRHQAALVFSNSSKQSHSQSSFSLANKHEQAQCLQERFTMIRTWFRSPRRASFSAKDIESAPGTPAVEVDNEEAWLLPRSLTPAPQIRGGSSELRVTPTAHQNSGSTALTPRSSFHTYVPSR